MKILHGINYTQSEETADGRKLLSEYITKFNIIYEFNYNNDEVNCIFIF